MLLNGAPYTGNGKHSKQKFVQARWSPDGRWLAYIVQRPDAEKGQLGQEATIDDGVWYVDTSTPNAEPIFVMRNTYDAPYDKPLRVAFNINWANDSDAMMITVRRPNGVSSILVGKGIRANDQAPGLFTQLNYVGGTWALDYQSYVGTTPPDFNGGATLGIVGRDIGKIQNIADGAAYKVWMQNPALMHDGRYLFLGKPSEDGKLHDGPTGLMLYAMWPGQPPSQLTPPLSGEVISASWSPNRTALVVTIKVGSQIQTKVLTTDGTVLDFTAQGRGSPGVHWSR
jgi:Tol biopolymer transport system component